MRAHHDFKVAFAASTIFSQVLKNGNRQQRESLLTSGDATLRRRPQPTLFLWKMGNENSSSKMVIATWKLRDKHGCFAAGLFESLDGPTK